jgi:deoxyribodipyrimidine photolyase-related protein
MPASAPTGATRSALWVIFGNQLFPVARLVSLGVKRAYLAEDDGLCTHFRYHKKKLVLFLAAMRRYALELDRAGVEVHYEALSTTASRQSYEEKLATYLEAEPAQEICCFEIEDKFMEQRMERFAVDRTIGLVIHASPMFLTSRPDFRTYLAGRARPFMKSFYEWQRRRLGILIDEDGSPVGRRWSFDTENRKKLPKTVTPPPVPQVPPSVEVREVSALVDVRFADHPGDTAGFWLPTNRAEALTWLDVFLRERFARFGAYEDAMSRQHDTLFHSVLTPMLNLGLLVPREVVIRALSAAKEHSIPLASVEGLIRQIIGWREFVRGIYREFSEVQDTANFFDHQRGLTPAWYDGTTGIEPLDLVVKRVGRLGWCHHIERLMVLSNLMLLCEVDPRQAHRWFMEMFVDSSDWVMGPNVYGMGQFSDGGIVATKPYLCASNYMLKMSDYQRGPWCDEVDALFWSFIDRHSTFLRGNPRLYMLVRSLERKPAAQRQELSARATRLRERLTTAPAL